MRRLGAVILLCIFLLAATSPGCDKAGGKESPKANKPRQVRLVPAEKGRLPRIVSVTGTLAADEEMPVGFKVAGRISGMAIDLGSVVKKNQVLARLDPTDFLLRVDQAEAGLRQARARLGLSIEGSDDKPDLEQTAPVREARALLNEARLNRDRMEKLVEKKLYLQD